MYCLKRVTLILTKLVRNRTRLLAQEMVLGVFIYLGGTSQLP